MRLEKDMKTSEPETETMENPNSESSPKRNDSARSGTVEGGLRASSMLFELWQNITQQRAACRSSQFMTCTNEYKSVNKVADRKHCF